ncbi:MAG TPA: 6-carboxytetrahydropterin synthase QueD [Candidatus Polarisedimenticolia bacterium]|jgi:6-pyruvoyltetrahydropterin/6-carboxytetrahydropterin synthase|nr:6-carboxytetrahydropterin synthase QueD [Candidatus Polarisedimenticolia bacterium]
MRISKRFRFEAAHRLPRYEGPCYHLHGHSYELHVTLEMPIDPNTGMTVDFFRLETLVREKVLDRLDHRNINDTLENPTAENITLWIWEQLKSQFSQLVEIKLYETPDSSVTYRGE